ncbi:hypothetical protein EMCRGX_G033035 [Ephydatia muelleri]
MAASYSSVVTVAVSSWKAVRTGLAFDLKVIHPLNTDLILEVSLASGNSAEVGEIGKHAKNDQILSQVQCPAAVVHENTEEARRKLLMLPKCCLPASKRSGRHHKPLDLTNLCDLWTRGQYGVLWHMATKRSTPTPPTAHGSVKSRKHIDSAYPLPKKACTPRHVNAWCLQGLPPIHHILGNYYNPSIPAVPFLPLLLFNPTPSHCQPT